MNIIIQVYGLSFSTAGEKGGGGVESHIIMLTGSVSGQQNNNKCTLLNAQCKGDVFVNLLLIKPLLCEATNKLRNCIYAGYTPGQRE